MISQSHSVLYFFGDPSISSRLHISVMPRLDLLQIGTTEIEWRKEKIKNLLFFFRNNVDLLQDIFITYLQQCILGQL
jgi:hypothetical protein